MKSKESKNLNKLEEKTRKAIDEKTNKTPEPEQNYGAASACKWKGLFLFILGKVEESRKCYDRSIELDPMYIYGTERKFLD